MKVRTKLSLYLNAIEQALFKKNVFEKSEPFLYKWISMPKEKIQKNANGF